MKFGGGFIQSLSYYFPILAGLLIGALAHIGRLMSEGQVPSFIQTLGFFFQLGIIGLIAVFITKKVGITDQDYRMLVAAILALSAHEVVQFAKRRGWKIVLEKAGVDDDGK